MKNNLFSAVVTCAVVGAALAAMYVATGIMLKICGVA